MVFSIAVETIGVGDTPTPLTFKQPQVVDIIITIIMSLNLQKCEKNIKSVVVVFMLSMLLHYYT